MSEERLFWIRKTHEAVHKEPSEFITAECDLCWLFVKLEANEMETVRELKHKLISANAHIRNLESKLETLKKKNWNPEGLYYVEENPDD